MKHTVLLALLILLSGAALAPAQLPDGTAVMEKVSEVFRGMEDLTADVEVHTQARQASGDIVLQYVRKQSAEPGVPEEVIRKYIVVTRMRVADGLVLIKQVNDGEYLWVERKLTATGEVRVARRRISPEGPVPGGFGPDWRKEIDRWRAKYNFRTLRSETFDGEPVVVVEGVRREHGEDPDAKQYPDLLLPDRMVLSVSTRDDFPRKVDMFSRQPQTDGRENTEQMVVSVRLIHVRLNKGLKPGTFKYTVPVGAEFIDSK